MRVVRTVVVGLACWGVLCLATALPRLRRWRPRATATKGRSATGSIGQIGAVGTLRPRPLALGAAEACIERGYHLYPGFGITCQEPGCGFVMVP